MALPDTYKQVEYIQSSWQNSATWQYINTWIIPTSANTTVKLRTMPMSSTYSAYLCAVQFQRSPDNWYYWLNFTSNRRHCWYWTSDTTPWHPIVDFSYTFNFWNTIYDIEYRNDDLYINNQLVANATTNVSTFTYPMFLFARNNYWSVWSCSSFRLYSCEIYQSNILVRDFIPVVRKADNKPWLYDLVNNIFYTNAGTWEFTYPARSWKVKKRFIWTQLVRPK